MPRVTPNDLNPRYDNYGKGSWNRPRKDEVDYREKLGRALTHCTVCNDAGYIHTSGEDKPCSACKPSVRRVTRHKNRVIFHYGSS